ncbi:putative phage abortive infection protein [Peribacillus sp. NPDC096448]|uniref:putative phage abortive infection protein n=1 Tax=Peribacillus sp. NPDC096448 TaxID=3364395 RepID=UPI00382A8167
MTEEEKRQYEEHLRKLIRTLNWSWMPIVLGTILVVGFKWNFEDLGPFGDFLAGSTVPLFTFVSAIGVILTLRLQQRQLEMQHEELKNSIMEIQETRKVMVEQGETMTLQRFESTFFNMINLHNTIIKSLSAIDDVGNKKTEREAFKVFLEKIRSKHNTYSHQQENGINGIADKLKSVYGGLYHDNEPIYGQYFRNLSTLITFVYTSEISEENKEKYMEIIKSQLSSIESTVLLYHGISSMELKYCPLCESII